MAPYELDAAPVDLGCPVCEDAAVTSYSFDCTSAIAIFPGGCGFGSLSTECPASCGSCPVEDDCGVCEGDGTSCLSCDDVDNDEICDDEDPCVGQYDDCGVCNGGGIAEGACDCDGNVDLGCGCGAAGPSGCDNACG